MRGEDVADPALTDRSAGEDRGNSSAPVTHAAPPGTFHPIADTWPVLGEQELQELADDIKASGLRYPIWRHRDGRIVDGRNRWRACQRIGVDCPSQTYTGADGAELVAFVVSLNEKRRHLTVDQRAAIAAELAALSHGSNQHQAKVEAPIGASTPVLTDAAAAQVMKVGERSVQRAKAVRRADPTLHAKVKKGTLKAGKARAEVERRTGAAARPKRTSATPTASVTAGATAGDRTTGTGPSGAELFKEIVKLRATADPNNSTRLKELRSIDRHSLRRLELLDAHVDSAAGFLEGLRAIRARLTAEAAP